MAKISSRAAQFPDSPIRGLEPLVKQALGDNLTIIPLNIGAPDTNAPLECRRSAINFLRHSASFPYGPSIGSHDYLAELVKYYTDKCGFRDLKEENLAITQGASEALDLVLYTIADQGDIIATFDPAYSNYLSIAHRHNLQLYPLKTKLESSFHPDLSTLAHDIPAQTKAILWSSPSNPSGAVYTKTELTALLKLSRTRDLWLIADEVYRPLDFTTKKTGFVRSLSILDLATPADRKRIIVLDSMSKLLGLCGARIGTLTASPEVISTLLRQASVRGSASTLSQSMCLPINDIPQSYYTSYRLAFKRRRDLLYHELSKLSSLGVTLPPKPPEGAFYLIVDLGVNALEFATWLITQYPRLSHTSTTVFITPMVTKNSGFYLDKTVGQNQARLAYVIKPKLLHQAVIILGKALKLYHRLKPTSTLAV